jgi:hypothetical protein
MKLNTTITMTSSKTPVELYRENFIPDGNQLRKGVSLRFEGQEPSEDVKQIAEMKILDWFKRAVPEEYLDLSKIKFIHEVHLDPFSHGEKLYTFGSYVKPTRSLSE